MKEIKTFEIAVKQNAKNLEELGINTILFWTYRTSKETGNKLIDFNEVIWGYDVVEIVQTLGVNGITGLIISSTFSSLLETLVAFEKQGISMAGLAAVKARYTDWKADEHVSIPIVQMTIGEAWTMWREGTIGIPKKDGGYKSVKYWVKYFDESNEDYGINGGKISKFNLKVGDEWTTSYDRGWDIEPTCEEANLALDILLDELN